MSDPRPRMDTRGPVYMLAVDHRWQWDEWSRITSAVMRAITWKCA